MACFFLSHQLSLRQASTFAKATVDRQDRQLSAFHQEHLLTTQLTDSQQRPVRYMRISVTDRCNLRCRYCAPTAGFAPDVHVGGFGARA